MTPPEVFAIYEHLRRSRTPDELMALAEIVSVTNNQTRGLSAADRLSPKFPCPFLIDARRAGGGDRDIVLPGVLEHRLGQRQPDLSALAVKLDDQVGPALRVAAYDRGSRVAALLLHRASRSRDASTARA